MWCLVFVNSIGITFLQRQQWAAFWSIGSCHHLPSLLSFTSHDIPCSNGPQTQASTWSLSMKCSLLVCIMHTHSNTHQGKYSLAPPLLPSFRTPSPQIIFPSARPNTCSCYHVITISPDHGGSTARTTWCIVVKRFLPLGFLVQTSTNR